MLLLEPLHYVYHVFNPLALAEDNFREAFAQGAMMIEAREAQVLVRQVAKALDRALDAPIAVAHLFK
jgi:hypothetical protein